MEVFEKTVYTFSPENAPIGRAKDGDILTFRTEDCFGGQIHSESDLVHELDLSKANPATGPVFIEEAEPGDAVVVDVFDISIGEKGFGVVIPETGPLCDLTEARTKIIPIENGMAKFNDITWPVDPMIGVLGLAPASGAVVSGLCGNHGGNMDSNKIKKGARVYLPVRVKGGLLAVGDLHATMGDGELSGAGLEIGGEVVLRVRVLKDFRLDWPLTELKDRYYVNVTGKAYDDALWEGCHEVARLIRYAYGWDATDILMYLSMQGSVEVNQGVKPIHGEMFNLRIGIPKVDAKPPIVPEIS